MLYIVFALQNMYIFLMIILSLIFIFLIIHIIISISLRRSIRASLVETYLHYTSKRKKHAKSRKKFDKYLKRHKDRSDHFIFPKIKLKSDIEEKVIENNQVFILSKKTPADIIIIYLHGGAYISQPVKYHWKYCDKLVNDLNATVVFPIYPLTPNHNWKDAFDFLSIIYFNTLKNTSLPIILMGDSSGGGLALSFNEYLAINNLKQPNDLILLSPWLDITLSSEKIETYEKKDPMLSCEPLREIGMLWASDIDPKDYRVSPLFGDISNLEKVTMIVGTREILFPEINLFHEKLKENNISCNLYIGKGMNHDFPLYPIPEAKKVNKYIFKTIREKCNN